MAEELTIVSVGQHTRLSGILVHATVGINYSILTPDRLKSGDLASKRVLFAVSLDEYGMAEGLDPLLRYLRSDTSAMEHSIGALILDGDTELYTKAVARVLIFDANRAGCHFFSRPYVEATKWLRNYYILSGVHNIEPIEAYTRSSCDLVTRLMAFKPFGIDRPQILLLHASSRNTSNTLALGSAVREQLSDYCDFEEIPLFSGEVYDCNGCSYKACLHFAGQQKCFYGGVVPDSVFPAIERCDAVMLCCPNYNDAPGAFFLALNNRLNAFGLRGTKKEIPLFALVVSGYSGGDLVAEQLLGGFCLNKFFSLPPRFAMLEIANDPGSVMHDQGIEDRINDFAAGMLSALCP